MDFRLFFHTGYRLHFSGKNRKSIYLYVSDFKKMFHPVANRGRVDHVHRGTVCIRWLYATCPFSDQTCNYAHSKAGQNIRTPFA